MPVSEGHLQPLPTVQNAVVTQRSAAVDRPSSRFHPHCGCNGNHRPFTSCTPAAREAAPLMASGGGIAGVLSSQCSLSLQPAAVVWRSTDQESEPYGSPDHLQRHARGSTAPNSCRAARLGVPDAGDAAAGAIDRRQVTRDAPQQPALTCLDGKNR
jgi:hypothetical protein